MLAQNLVHVIGREVSLRLISKLTSSELLSLLDNISQNNICINLWRSYPMHFVYFLIFSALRNLAVRQNFTGLSHKKCSFSFNKCHMLNLLWPNIQ